MPDAKIHGTSPDRTNRSKPKNTGNNPWGNAAKIVAPFTSVISSGINSMRGSSAKIGHMGGKRRRTRQKKNRSKKRRTYRRK
jgi:hypothetical protein